GDRPIVGQTRNRTRDGRRTRRDGAGVRRTGRQSLTGDFMIHLLFLRSRNEKSPHKASGPLASPAAVPSWINAMVLATRARAARFLTSSFAHWITFSLECPFALPVSARLVLCRVRTTPEHRPRPW